MGTSCGNVSVMRAVRLGGMEYVIYETPHKPVENSIDSAYPESPEPTTEKPTQDSSAEEMPTVYKELNKYNKNKSMTFEITSRILSFLRFPKTWKNVRLWKTPDGKKFRTLRERERR